MLPEFCHDQPLEGRSIAERERACAKIAATIRNLQDLGHSGFEEISVSPYQLGENLVHCFLERSQLARFVDTVWNEMSDLALPLMILPLNGCYRAAAPQVQILFGPDIRDLCSPQQQVSRRGGVVEGRDRF